MADAPVCHIPSEDSGVGPLTTRLPAIPTPTANIDSLLRAVMALKMGYELLAGQRDNMAPARGKSNVGGVTGFKGNKKPPPKGRWEEKTRQVETVKITNPNDPTQFVEVTRIKRLVMRDSVTGEEWVYQQ